MTKRLLAPLLVVVTILLVSVPDARGQEAAAGAFARFGFDAHGLALGNALGASPASNTSPYYNPALAPNAEGQTLTASVGLLSFDRQLQSLQFGTPLGPSAGVALGIIRAGVDDIDGRDANGNRTETLATDEYALFLAFGNRFKERLSIGASLKLYQANYLDDVDNPLGFGLDLGLTYDVTERGAVSFIVADLLAKYEWNTSAQGGRTNTDRFPVRLRLAGHYGFLSDGRLKVMAEYESQFVRRDERQRVPALSGGSPTTQFQTESLLLHQGGGRIGVAYPLAEILEIRGGVDRIGVDGTSGMRPSAGFGVRESIGELDLEVSYAFVLEPYVTDTANFVSVRMHF
ncbi:hypothetical protein CRI94_04980 [Longibacter salinarum]|uniref:PorV/PorQ family protein n=1 Tax=Longibacter salinarum TaxID=1850348 RepID=A0A2A8D0I5_9BACT|nr:hypothetical protein [Longibacter salinarum]PEN14390.1 hypothetical protein CRI94_04980 [Longibacter salinarum]